MSFTLLSLNRNVKMLNVKRRAGAEASAFFCVRWGRSEGIKRCEGINFLKKSGGGNVTFRDFPYYKGEEGLILKGL